MAESVTIEWTRDNYSSAINEVAHLSLGDRVEVIERGALYRARSFSHRRALMDNALMATVGCLDAELP